jgi:phospholipid transport system substrate-binding protein
MLNKFNLNKILFKFLIFTFFIAFSSVITLANSYALTPKEFTENVANEAVKIIESKKTEDEKEKSLIALFKQNVDTDWMARFTMGKYFRQATPEQQSKFKELYRDFVIYSYIPKFRAYSGEKIDVNQVIKDEQSEEFYTVKTNLKTDKSKTGTVLVDYKLRKIGDSFKIVDIIGEGISLISTQRSDFATPLSEQGIDAFLEKLSVKVADLKAHPDSTVGKK